MSGEPASDAFPSLNALRDRNEQLLDAAAASDRGLGGIADDMIGEFLARAVATGRNIVDPAARRAAQDIVNYWAAERITRVGSAQEWTPPRLVDPVAAGAAAGSTPDATPALPDVDLQRSLAMARIAAGARQYRASGGEGWLLKGTALEEAEEVADKDVDIKVLVDASRAAVRRRNHITVAGLAGLIVVLSVLVVFLLIAWGNAMRSEGEAREAAEQAKKDRAIADNDAERIRELYRKQADEKETQANSVREQQATLDGLQAALRAAIPIVKAARDAGVVNKIPDILVPMLGPVEPTFVPPDANLVRGYDPSFLRPAVGVSVQGAAPVDIRLPRLSEPARRRAWEDGKPVDYVNYSVVIDRERRMPLLAAINLQRSALTPLLRLDVPFRRDTRVPDDVQLDPNWAGWHGTGIEQGRLANSREIAWGSAFGAVRVEAGRLAYGMVNVMTNVTPQYKDFRLGIWSGAERYVREDFSARSDRVTIFTGPVFAPTDPATDGIQMPRSFWKVLIALQPGNSTGLVVEAYLMSQLDADGKKVNGQQPFEPQGFRTRVTDIERLTGLDFGEAVRRADSAWFTESVLQPTSVATRGDRLVDLLPRIAASGPEVRQPAMQQLFDAIRDPGLDPADLRKLAGAAVAMASDASFKKLGPEARINVLTLLTKIPGQAWNDPAWVDLRAAARRAVADATATLGGCAGGGQACDRIKELRPALDWDLANGRTVYMQFAGFVRGDVQALSDKLRQLGWNIPGEERLASAAGSNEVRYGPGEDERRAAELLAADLRALGRGNIRAKRVDIVKPRILEVWIGL